MTRLMALSYGLSRRSVFSIVFLIAGISLPIAVLHAQNTNPWPATGNVGIGTANPVAPLDVHGANLGLNLGNGSEIARFSVNTPNISQLRFWLKRYKNEGGTGWLSASTRIQAFTDVDGQGYIDFNPADGLYGMAFGTDLSDAGAPLETMRLLRNGFVGIGTTAPGSLLEVKTPGPLGTAVGSTAEIARFSTTTGNYSQLKILFNRYVPENGNGWMTASTRIQAWTDNVAQAYIDFNPSNGTYGMAFGANSADVMRILPDGNVLIGKTAETNAGYKLDVNGNVRANKVVVNTTGADYVFDSTYRLLPLPLVEKYITEHHHLPEVAAAGQMRAQGLDLGDNQTTLLKKIEELTLYIIGQQRQIEALTQQNKKVEDLQMQVAELKALLRK